MSNQIQMKVSKKKTLEAKLYYFFQKNLINFFFKGAIYLTFFITIIFTGLVYFGFIESFLISILAALIFIITFVIYNFSYNYLAYLESEQSIGKNELGEILSFDVLRATGKLNIEKAEVDDFYSKNFKNS
jgi:hypothetical protein